MKTSTAKARQMHDTREHGHGGNEWKVQEAVLPAFAIGHRPRVFIGCTGHGPRSAPSHRPLSRIIGREQQL